jgi:AraC-like DNA-binding protein
MTHTHHAPNQVLPRHQHTGAFAALVLSGHYAEAGDTGCHRVGPGDVLIHQAFESHIDRFADERAEVLVIPLPGFWNGPLLGRIADPDRVARTAEHDVTGAAELLAREMIAKLNTASDWPDLLARELRADPAMAVGGWAERMGLHPGSISRGFRQVFGLTPAAFRLIARTHQAIAAIRVSRSSLCAIAGDSGFADQAHMSRAVGKVAGMSPARLRCRLSVVSTLAA